MKARKCVARAIRRHFRSRLSAPISPFADFEHAQVARRCQRVSRASASARAQSHAVAVYSLMPMPCRFHGRAAPRRLFPVRAPATQTSCRHAPQAMKKSDKIFGTPCSTLSAEDGAGSARASIEYQFIFSPSISRQAQHDAACFAHD